jgi:hypothetical protein
MPYTADAIQRILCIAFFHSPNNIFQQEAFCFFLNMDHKLFPWKMEENRDENQKLLEQKKSLIIKQISAAKSKVLKYLDDIKRISQFILFFSEHGSQIVSMMNLQVEIL